jgi:hypothetical protein
MKKRRSNEFDGWVEAHECWRRAQVLVETKVGKGYVGIAFERALKIYAHWWQNCARNPHGWDITIKARGIRK